MKLLLKFVLILIYNKAVMDNGEKQINF